MNGKLDAAPRLYPISPWSDAVFKSKIVYLRVFVDIWIDGLQQHFFGILLTMPKHILQTNLFENVDAHRCDGMTTYGNLVKFNFNKNHGPFLLDTLPYGVLLKTSTYSFVVNAL